MKYFTELLESYSKLKKRKLKLLIEAEAKSRGNKQNVAGEDKISAAKKALQDALAQVDNSDPKDPNKPPTHENPFVVTTPRGEQLAVFYNRTSQGGNIGWRFSKLTSDGKGINPGTPAGGGSGNPSADAQSPNKKFIAKFSQDQGKVESGNEQPQPSQEMGQPMAVPQIPQVQIDPMAGTAGAQIANSFNQILAESSTNPAVDPNSLAEIQAMGQEAYQNIVEASNNFQSAQKYFESWHKQLGGDKRADRTSIFLRSLAGRARSYIFGAAGQSIESKITKTSYTLVETNRDGIFTVTRQGTVTPQDLHSYSKIMKEFFEIFKSDGSTKIKDKINKKIDFLRKRFTLNSDGTVTIHLGETPEDKRSLVLIETPDEASEKGLFRLMLESVQRNFDEDPNGQKPQLPKVNILKKASAGFNNAVRGTLLEKMLIYNTLINNYHEAKRTGDEVTAAKWRRLIEAGVQADKNFRTNLSHLRNLNEEWNQAGEVAALQEQNHYLNTALNEFFGEDASLLFKATEVITSDVRRKKPFTMIHAGLETGPGLKADAIEVYLEPQKDSSKEIASQVPQLADYINAGLINADSIVYIKRPDYKHYLDYGSNTEFNAGGSSRNSIFELIKGNTQVGGTGVYRRGILISGPSQDRTRLIAYNNSNLIGGPESVPSLQEFLTEIESNIASVDKISNNNYDPQTGQSKDLASQLAGAVRKVVKSNFSYSDTQKDNILSRFYDAAKEYSEITAEEEKKKASDKLISLAKLAFTSLHIHKKLSSNKESDVVVAKNMLLSVVNSAAGSVQQGAYSVNRIMGHESTRQYEFQRNAPLEFFQQLIKNGGPKNIQFKGSDFVLKDDDGTVLGTVVYDSKKDNFSLYYDENFLRNKLGIQPSTITYRQYGTQRRENTSVLEAFIVAQKNLLETLMLMQKESIGKDKKIRQL